MEFIFEFIHAIIIVARVLKEGFELFLNLKFLI